MQKLFAATVLTLGLSPALGAATQPDPAVFDAILADRARAGGFDYRAATGQDKKRLAAYLANLGDAQPTAMNPEEKKAFYINAYNALAIQTLLENPGKSIRDVSGAFNKAKHKVAGEMLTLDDIENRLRESKDARIHFAIVCASKSCPPLAPRAYTGEGLSEALEKQGRVFVNDPARNVIDRGKGRVALSKIFYWNRKEFERDGGSLVKLVSRYVNDSATAAWLAASTKEPEFLEYDWAPNQP
ncbi:MAG: DUF547 domain-containing protein [Thermoanaerobaculia bacterium]